MKHNEKGFSVIAILIVIFVVGLLGVVGWFVYERQNSKVDGSSATTQPRDNNDTQISNTETDIKTLDAVKYTVPTEWETAKDPFLDLEVAAGSGLYLLSPDYSEVGDGQLSINAGAYIYFEKLEWVGIDKNTSLEQAANIVKNNEGSYIDSKSVALTKVGDVQVVMFDNGHNSDGVSVFHKTSGGQWLDASFSTTTGGDGDHNAQDSPHYKTFLAWLEKFVELNP